MLAKGSPEVGVVQYEFACLFVNYGCEEVQLTYSICVQIFFLYSNCRSLPVLLVNRGLYLGP